MSEINERPSTNVECPLSPLTTTDEARTMSDNVFEKVSSFVMGQVDGTIADYKLIQTMNESTAQRYGDMKQVASTISGRLSELAEKYDSLRPYLQQIDDIDTASKRLENVVESIESYITALEAKLKILQQPPGQRM